MAKGIYRRTRYIEASIPAFKVALEAFNSPTNPYRYENALILMVNAVELLSKALLLKLGEKIEDGGPDRTISAEKAINKLLHFKEIEQIEHETLQQLISLRNEATHSYLGKIDADLALFLFFSAYKYFEKIIQKHFKGRRDIFKDNYLSISTDQNRTYADSVVGLFRSKKEADRRLLYLLERGVKYTGGTYISQSDFEQEFRRNKGKRLENKSALGGFLSRADMLKIVFVQAPKNYTVDVTLGRNKKNSKNILPVSVVGKLQCEKNTHEIAEIVGVRPYDVHKFIKEHAIKGDPVYHQEIPNGKNPPLHRYSEKLAELMKKSL